MNGREIPGYYYDSEKKKYFAIQKNHVAPEGSKYSRDHVRKELEQSKKRKRTVALQQKREAQTVQRSMVLRHPLISGISLSREHGGSRYCNLEARTTALARQSKSSELVALQGCHSCGRRDTIFDFALDQGTDSILWGLGSQHFGRLQYLADSHSTYELAAFRSNISSLAITNNRAIVATSTSPTHPGNVYIASLSESSDEAGLTEPSGEARGFPILDAPAPTYLLLGHDETTLWTSCPNPPGGQDVVAIGGSEQAYMIRTEGNILQTYNVGYDVRAIDWLNPNTAIGGTRKRPVLLWDARTGGASSRFYHSSGVTAIRSLGNGSQVLVCGFDGMAVYDVRMPARQKLKAPHKPSPAVLRMPFKTERPSVAMDVKPDANLVAVADDTNVIQVHSLLSGKQVAELGKPDHSKDREYYKRLRFLEGNDGKPTLLACQGSTLLEWTWGGSEDDEG